MTIHNLMNAGNVTADVHIDVFDQFCTRLIYSGRYDETTEYIYNLEIDQFRVTSTRDRDGEIYIDRVTIYTED